MSSLSRILGVGSGAPFIQTLTGNAGGAIAPNGSGNINVVGDATTVYITGNAGAHSLTASVYGGTSGQILVSQGAAAAHWQNAAAAIGTIDGDTGSITGSTVTIYANQASNVCGQTVSFTGSGTLMNLNVTDSGDNMNTLIGLNSGLAGYSGSSNTALGFGALGALTSGGLNTAVGSSALSACADANSNSAFGQGTLRITTGAQNTGLGTEAGFQLTSGTNNTFVGFAAGYTYTSSESDNIIIGTGSNSEVLGESNVLRIGAATGTGNFQLNSAYISGINGNTVSNTQMVTIDSVSNQLGVASIPGPGTAISLAYLNTSISNVTGDGTQYTIVYDSVFSDPGSNFNTGTGVFTAPVTGNYEFNLLVSMGNLPIGITRAIVYLVTSSATYKPYDLVPVPGAGGELIYSFSTASRMSSGDTATVQVRVFGSTLTVEIEGSSGGSQYPTTFSAYYVSA